MKTGVAAKGGLSEGKSAIGDYALAHGQRALGCSVSHPMGSMPMKSLRALALASLVTSVSFSARADEVPLSSDASNEHFETQVLAVDPANYRVTIEGLDKRPVSIPLTDQAKAMRNLKVGDKVDIRVTRSVDYVLNTSVDGAPSVSNDSWINRAPPDSLPGGEVFSALKVTSKITNIDMKKNEVTLLRPDGKEVVVTVNNPKIQAQMLNLQIGQTVDAIQVEVLKVETSR